MGVGISGRRDHAWIMQLAQNRERSLKHNWAHFLAADAFLWWQETYGADDLRRNWRTKVGLDREDEHWKSGRAAELKKVVAPVGIKLPTSLK